jgi:hypothetical protein
MIFFAKVYGAREEGERNPLALKGIKAARDPVRRTST